MGEVEVSQSPDNHENSQLSYSMLTPLEEHSYNHLAGCRIVNTPDQRALVHSVRGHCPLARYAGNGLSENPIVAREGLNLDLSSDLEQECCAPSREKREGD